MNLSAIAFALILTAFQQPAYGEELVVAAGDEYATEDVMVGPTQASVEQELVPSDLVPMGPAEEAEFPATNEKLMQSCQFPFGNSDATTVHKAQGRTEPCVCTSLTKDMKASPGQAYTACSRSTRSGAAYIDGPCPDCHKPSDACNCGLHLINLDEAAFAVERKCLNEYNRLRLQTESWLQQKRRGWHESVYQYLRAAVSYTEEMIDDEAM